MLLYRISSRTVNPPPPLCLCVFIALISETCSLQPEPGFIHKASSFSKVTDVVRTKRRNPLLVVGPQRGGNRVLARLHVVGRCQDASVVRNFRTRYRECLMIAGTLDILLSGDVKCCQHAGSKNATKPATPVAFFHDFRQTCIMMKIVFYNLRADVEKSLSCPLRKARRHTF